MHGRVEAEVKVPVECNEIEAIIEKLRELGAVIEGPLREEDVYFLHPCRDVIARDEAIRVRLSPKGVKISYKGPRMAGEVKARLEIESTADESILDLLEALGFKEGLRVVKLRVYADLPRAVVTIDNVEELGCYVEVEARTGDPREIEETLEILGLSGKDRITESYAVMLLRKKALGGR